MRRMGDGAEGCRVYLITPPRLEPAPFADLLAAALDAGGPTAGPDPAVAAVQLRLKDVSDDDWRRAIDALRPVAQSRGVAFLLNDRADLVRATGCDGVHVGQDDMPARQARALIGPEATLGVTCKGSRDLAMQAGEDGADYVAFGAFFPFGHQGCDALRRSGNPPVVVGADGAALLRHRRHHAGELCPPGAGGRGFPRGGRVRVEPSRRAGRRRAGVECGDRGGAIPVLIVPMARYSNGHSKRAFQAGRWPVRCLVPVAVW